MTDVIEQDEFTLARAAFKPLEGLDFAWGRPSVRGMRANGKHFVARYLYPGGGKGITQGELDTYIRNGVPVVFIYEGTAGGMRRGYAQGVHDAEIAQHELNKLSGVSHSRPIYFAKDYDGAVGHGEAQYMAGVAHVIGKARAGGYGQFSFIEWLHAEGYEWGFQTYAWSYGRVSTHAALYQHLIDTHLAGADVDLTRALKPEYGQHGVGAEPKPSPSPKPSPKKPTDVTHYRVRQGDSLSTIGAKFGIPWSHIYAANKHIIGSNPNVLKIGTELTIPSR